jgi:hypothetical protein
MWSALALWIAWAWDQAPRALRLAGNALTLLVGVVLAGTAALAANVLPILPPSPWPSARSVVALIALAIIASCAVATYFAWRNREDLAIATVMLGMVPIGLGAAEAMARYGAQFSLADVSPLVQPQPGDEGTVLFEGSPHAGSSLPFYLEREPVLISDPTVALEKMAAAQPVYLIVHKERVVYWQRQLTERFHLYHQIGTCGPYVIIDNQP